MTVEELLYGLLLCSGNDAAEALADGCGGTASFVRRMNSLAGELGMEDSRWRMETVMRCVSMKQKEPPCGQRFI